MRPRPRWRASSAPSRATAENADAHAARHPQPPPRRAWRGLPATRACASTRCRSTTPPARDARASSTHAKRGLGRGARARREARLPQRAGDRDRADRHDRPRDGLRHHRHRARLRAREVQEARRRRLLQDHQPRRAGGAARARLPRGARSPRSRPMRSATARSARRPAINPATLRGARASPTRRSPRSRSGAEEPPSTSSSSSTSGRSARTSSPARSEVPAEKLDDPAFDLLALPRLLEGRDRGRQHPCLRRDDARGRAASSSPSTTRCSIAPTRAAASASAISRSRATSA